MKDKKYGKSDKLDTRTTRSILYFAIKLNFKTLNMFKDV